MDIRISRWWLACLTLASVLVAGVLVVSCTPSPTPSPSPPAATAPAVSLLAPSDTVCGTATQIRLQVNASDDLASENPGAWDLISSNGDRVAEGSWIVRDGVVLIPFPDNAPLTAGRYIVHLRWRDSELAVHTFSIGPSRPILQALNISIVPGGAPVSTLWVDAPIRLFYINYAFEGGCAGAPYWISTQQLTGEIACTQHGVLESMDGEGTVACYHEDGSPFAIGRYETEMILMGEVSEVVAFEIAEIQPTLTPRPTVTPRPLAVSCEALFTAAGITPEGELYLPLSFFDWYTQGVYAGSRCRNLQPGMLWRSAWMRDGARVQEGEGTWEGPAEGTVWDVLTGTPGNPFVSPGTYTVTLEIGGTTSTAAFSVYGYTPAENTER